MEAMLCSDFIEAAEEEILAVVLRWSELSSASSDDSSRLVSLVRLPLVPLASTPFRAAVAAGLVPEDRLSMCANCGVYSYGLYSYGLYSYGVCSDGLYSYG